MDVVVVVVVVISQAYLMMLSVLKLFEFSGVGTVETSITVPYYPQQAVCRTLHFAHHVSDVD